MKVIALHLNNIKSFSECKIKFSRSINVIVGANNSGKSTILNSIGVLQQPRVVNSSYTRARELEGTIRIDIDQTMKQYFTSGVNNVRSTTRQTEIVCFAGDRAAQNSPGIPNVEPGNYIIPFLSRRKVPNYSEGITLQDVNQVSGTLSNLYAKIDRISNPEFQPAHDTYIKACDDILGFRVTTSNSSNGKKGVYIIQNTENIPIDTMGEGIANILGLVVDFCLVKNRLFLIEEPENDIHPKALKRLLDLLVTASEHNQFIITTHSNIVVRHLASIPGSKLFSVTMQFIDKIPTSTIDDVKTPEKRKNVLEDLGYELHDFDLWEYWIILEESSAERIIREFLIPWFLPNFAGRVRTYSARSLSEVETKFTDFNNLFVFLHLEPTYRNKAFVIIDGGAGETKIIETLKDKYLPSGWHDRTFSQFNEHDFESYYPEQFRDQAAEILSSSDKQTRRELKAKLVEAVVEWANQNPDLAKREFEVSFSKVIEKLKHVLTDEPQS